MGFYATVIHLYTFDFLAYAEKRFTHHNFV